MFKSIIELFPSAHAAILYSKSEILKLFTYNKATSILIYWLQIK